MGLGTGIALLVVGGILAFGIKDSFSAVDLTAIGYICMGAGVLAIILKLVLQQQRQRTSHTAVVERRDINGGGTPPVVCRLPCAAGPAASCGGLFAAGRRFDLAGGRIPTMV